LEAFCFAGISFAAPGSVYPFTPCIVCLSELKTALALFIAAWNRIAHS